LAKGEMMRGRGGDEEGDDERKRRR